MRKLMVFFFSLLFFFVSNAGAQVITLVPEKTIDNRLVQGERHTYEVQLESGQYTHITVEQIDIDVVVLVLDPKGEKVEEVDGSERIENILIEASTTGTYQLEVYLFQESEVKEGNYRIQIEELLSATQYKERLESERARHEATIQWLREKAIPLESVEAEQGFDDMLPLKQIIGGARLVALGEATHGTREFFQLKHRMLEFLVTELGFNIFAIEATMPEGFDVNEYVLTGKGDPEKALAGLYFWTWNTEEVLDMIRWMRRYNADPGNKKKVKFYGFDMQDGTRAWKVLTHYLSRVDRQAAGCLKNHDELSLIKNPYTKQDFRDITKEKNQEALDIIATTMKLLDKNKSKYMAQTGEKEWEIAQLHANILSQYIQYNTPSDNRMAGFVVRDSSMAANIRWILDHEGPDAKMVIWAHNGHVGTGQLANVNVMGHHLRSIYGAEMVVFGFAFHQGSFQAIEMPIDSRGGLRPFHVEPLLNESLDGTLGAIGFSLAAVDLSKLPDSGKVAEWFAEPRATRSIGAGFANQFADYFARPQKVTEKYDALLFVNQTTAARPNPGGRRPRPRTLTTPENLDFENSDPGLIPKGWRANKYRLDNFDFAVETSNEQPQGGRRCVKISRMKGKHYGETYGSLSQRLDATPYRGKKIKLQAAVRTELDGFGNDAYLWMRVTKGEFGAQANLFKDTMRDRPIRTKEWRFFEIVGDVPDEAQWIELGMALSGEGSAWFDSFSLEEVEE